MRSRVRLSLVHWPYLKNAVHPLSIVRPKRIACMRLRPGELAAHGSTCLPLLPSGPDGVHKVPLHETRSSTPLASPLTFRRKRPRVGIRPRYSGLRVQGTATSPPSTAKRNTSKNETQMRSARPIISGASLRCQERHAPYRDTKRMRTRCVPCRRYSQRCLPLGRNQGRKYAYWTIYGVLLVLFLLVTGTLANQDAPGPTPHRARDSESATPQPATLGELRSAIEKTEQAVSAGAWTEAKERAMNAKEKWLSYRTPMQASAGRRMWTTDVMRDFQAAMDGLIVAVDRRDTETAHQKIDSMLETIENYDDQTEGRLETAPERD